MAVEGTHALFGIAVLTFIAEFNFQVASPFVSSCLSRSFDCMVSGSHGITWRDGLLGCDAM